MSAPPAPRRPVPTAPRGRPAVPRRLGFAAVLMALLQAAAAAAATPPCLPCAGVTVAHPAAAAAALAPLALPEEARLYVRWRHRLSDPWDPAPGSGVAAAGGTPWVELVFAVESPLLEHLEQLDAELAAAAAVAAAAAPVAHFEVAWHPATGETDPEQYAFLFKRAAVAVSGAAAGARVIAGGLAPSSDELRAFYGQETAAYLDGLGITGPASEAELAALGAALVDLDPGRPLVLSGLPFPGAPRLAVAAAARAAAAGAAVVFFDLPSPTAEQLAPLAILAAETQGDLSYDPASRPTGAADSWAFVREDLGMRVVVAPQAPGAPLRLTFPDPLLRRPRLVDLETGEQRDVFAMERLPDGLALSFDEPPAAFLLAVDRATAGELEGIEEEIRVETGIEMPVEEILRRLQTFEDAQARRLRHYSAVNTSHLRFEASGTTSVEATFQGPMFYREGEGFDWVWEKLFFNGVRWRGERLPEIPLLQPERAAALPLLIHFTPQYEYRLRGTDVVEGREAWVVDFEPRDPRAAADQNLFQGTVWVDREHYGRLKSRALQLGLGGEVISNEETTFYRPVDASGEPAPWTPQAFWLPLRVVGQQLLSVINNATVVEKETLLTDLEINDAGFEERWQAALASELTMLRDTERGLRYLVKDEETGERVVKEGFDPDKLFLLGGVFWDDALDFPLPLAGVNWFSFDWRGTGTQVNFFWGGPLLTVDVATPDAFGSRFDAGVDLFALAVPLADEMYRSDEEVPGEEVEITPASFELKGGRPIGSFFRLGASYDASWFGFGGTDDTADDFRVPDDHILHSLELDGRYSRSGYRLSFAGSYNTRSRWEPWGTPEQRAAFDPDTEDFLRWEASLAKTWYFSGFRKLAAELAWLGGEDLDRFSKYGFGFFGGSRVHGYQSGRVRAEEVTAAHVAYGFDLGEVFRVEGIADAAWATDEESGLADELLAGVGASGTFMGPWQTIMQLDVGVPVAGPDDGFVLYLVFLKLFR